MVGKRIRGQIGVALLAAMLAASLVGAIGTVGAATSVAPSEPTSGPSSAAIDTGFLQVENGTRIAFEHTGGERASYEVTVSGSIEAGPEADLEDAESVDRVSAGRATGSVAEGGTDDFFFTGEITSLAVDGPVTVYVDGQQVDPEEIGGGTTTTDTETAATTTATTTATATATETSTPTTRTTTETATTTTTASATPTETSTPTETATRTETATTTETETAAPTRSRATTPGGDGGGSTALSEQERDLFLTIGGVLLLGIIAIGGFALLARR